MFNSQSDQFLSRMRSGMGNARIVIADIVENAIGHRPDYIGRIVMDWLSE